MIEAIRDPRLRARVVAERPLVYTEPASPELDRPPHVRAASGIEALGDELYVVQDDASFIAVVRGDDVRSIALPAGPGGRRRFEKALGNKLDKLDLEACFSIFGRVIAIGSGSLPVRERFAIVHRGEVRMFDASALYARLREVLPPCALNIEGACFTARGGLHLFQRGNGAARGHAVNAMIDVNGVELWNWIDGHDRVPEITGVRLYDLGREDGVAYGFTDATSYGCTDGNAIGNRVLFAAGAEDSPDAIEDGEVLGARLGVLSDERVAWTELLEADGSPSRRKIEGITRAHDRVLAVVDADDPDRPAELCEIVLEGPW